MNFRLDPKYKIVNRIIDIDSINNILATNKALGLDVIDYDIDSNYEKGSIFKGL